MDGEYCMMPARNILEQHGLRCTKQRVALYEALAFCTSHPTADELYQMVRIATDRLSLATVYNTLEAFSRAGLCRPIPAAGGVMRYDADISDHPHVRLESSGEIRDVPHDLGEKLVSRLPRDVIRQIERRMGLTIDRVQVQLVGDSTEGPK